MGARACLRMVLHAEKRQGAMAQALERAVVQVDVSELDFALVDRVRIDSIIVVVRSDLHLAGLRLLYGMVPSMMSKLEFVSLAAKS